MKTQDEILDFLRTNKALLREKFHVTEIALFGSFARNEQNSNSDVDLLIELAEDAMDVYDTKERIKYFLSHAFERSVDIAREKYLKPYAKEAILRDAHYV